jgi:hypothetical protein
MGKRTRGGSGEASPVHTTRAWVAALTLGGTLLATPASVTLACDDDYRAQASWGAYPQQPGPTVVVVEPRDPEREYRHWRREQAARQYWYWRGRQHEHRHHGHGWD